MRDVSIELKQGQGCLDGFVDLALEAIGRLAARRMHGVAKLQTALVDKMVELATGPEQTAMDPLWDEFREARVPAEEVATLYIPEAARQVGAAWDADRIGFAQVTVALARLQDMVHEIQSGYTADATGLASGSTVLLIVPPGEQHTLGALIVATELRRRGVSVRMLFAPGLSDLSRLMANTRFDAALITVGSADRLEICAKLVKTLSSLTKGRMRVAIGGAVVTERAEALARTGADLVTNDLDAVVREFALA